MDVMFPHYVYCYFLLLNIPSFSAATSKPVDVDFCESSRNKIVDCGYQISNASPGSCKMFTTEACVDHRFKPWDNTDVTQAVIQNDLDFSFEASSYYWHSYGITLNISFTALTSDVTGFSFTLLEYGGKNYNTCRVFEFHNLTDSNQVTTYYDCYRSIIESDGSNYFHFLIKSFPRRMLAEYDVVLGIPFSENEIQKWQSTILIFIPSLNFYTVEGKFSQAPKEFDITEYEVFLRKDKQIISHYTVNVKQPNGRKMITFKFEGVNPGVYDVAVRPNHPDSSATMSSLFRVLKGPTPPGVMIGYIFASLTVALVLIAFLIAINHFCLRLKRKDPPRVIVIYSWDSEEHYSIIKKFVDLLTWDYRVLVAVDYSECLINKDPTRWLSHKLKESDFIILVVSEGVYQKFKTNNQPPVKEAHPWGDLVVRAIAEIGNNLESRKKLIKILFNYATREQVPLTLQNWGKTFKLPKNSVLFYRYLYNIKTLFPWDFLPFYRYLQQTENNHALSEAIKCMRHHEKRAEIC